MGICFWEARQLWRAYQDGVSLRSVLTIGRQNLSLHPHEIQLFRREFRRRTSDAPDPFTGYIFGDFADRFFREALGVEELHVLDASNYEGADLLHDLNVPVPLDWHCRFDAVVECGTLEHVFNLPTALGNLMQMVRPGGTIFLSTPANNLCGHGFYQFSPELMYRVFSPANGFAVKHLAVYAARSPSVELSGHAKAYLVPDPDAVGDRVRLMSDVPVMMFLMARRDHAVAPFRTFPIQSDYARAWHREHQEHAVSGGRALWRRLYGSLPNVAQLFWRRQREIRDASLRHGPHFRPMPDV